MLFALIYITSCSSSEQTGSDSTAQVDDLNSVMDYPITGPIQVLQQLIDITDNSNGLNSLYLNSRYLSKKKLLKDEVRIKYLYTHHRFMHVYMYIYQYIATIQLKCNLMFAGSLPQLRM